MSLISVLNDMDFNSYEKEAILFLCKVESATATEIVKEGGIPQGRVYQILHSLKEKGFVQVIPISPKQYKIDDIKQSLKKYVHAKEVALKEKRGIIDALELAPKLEANTKNSPSVYIIQGRQEHLNALADMRARAKKEILQIAPMFVGSFTSNREAVRAVERGVKTRIIIQGVTARNEKRVKKCLGLGAEFRQTSGDMLSMLIRDGEEFLLSVEDFAREEERLLLISRNKAVLATLQATFERIWKDAEVVK